MRSPDPTPHLEQYESYEHACSEFRWQIPGRLNIATGLCRRHADAGTRIALVDVKLTGANTYTFGGLDYLSDKFAVVLSERGLGQGHRVVIALPQSAAAAVALLAVLKMGAVAVVVPSTAPALIPVAIERTAAAAVVLDQETHARVVQNSFNKQWRQVFVVGHRLSKGDYEDFWRVVTFASSEFEPADTESSASAFVFFGNAPERARPGLVQPIAVVHSHASVIGQFPAFEMANGFDFSDESVFWTPSDWSLPSMLLGMLLPALWYGCAVVAQDKALPAGWLAAVENYEVTNAFLSETHLRLMLEAELVPREHGFSKLRTVVTDGPIEVELKQRCARSFGARASILRGWPEAPCIIAACDRWFTTREGWAGRVAPGHQVEVVDDGGRLLSPGTRGRIAIQRPDPACAIEILGERGGAKGPGSVWPLTQDAGLKDDSGLFWISGERRGTF